MIFGIFEVIFSLFLPYIFENNLWSNELPPTIEEFNLQYESKINRILFDNSNKSSTLLEYIITNKIELKDESDYEYNKLLGMHEELLIDIRNHIEIEQMHKSIESLYLKLAVSIRNIKNITFLVLAFYFISLVLYFLGFFNNNLMILHVGIFCLTFYSFFRIIELYLRFNDYKNIPRSIDKSGQ